MVASSVTALRTAIRPLMRPICRLDVATDTADGAGGYEQSWPAGTIFRCFVYAEGPGGSGGGKTWQSGADQSVTIWLHDTCPAKPGDRIRDTEQSKTYEVNEVQSAETHGAVVVARCTQVDPSPGPGA